MAGLEKIKSQILDEAKKTANVKIEDAKAQAEQMKTQCIRPERACEISHRSSEKNETSGSKAGDDRRDHREGV